MRREQQQVTSQRNDGGWEIEGQEETEQTGRPHPLSVTPEIACHAPGQRAAEQGIQGAFNPHPRAVLSSGGPGYERGKGRLIEPDVAVECAARVHLPGGGQRQRFLGPEHVYVAQTRGGEQREQRQEECDRPVQTAAVLASRCSSLRRKAPPYSGSASANSTKLSK